MEEYCCRHDSGREVIHTATNPFKSPSLDTTWASLCHASLDFVRLDEITKGVTSVMAYTAFTW